MEELFAILSQGVHRFEGTVDKFTGDGIMALFGAPIAHENHAQRACYAALRLQDELASYAAELRRSEGLSLSVRMGINSGQVVVGSVMASCQLGQSLMPMWSCQTVQRRPDLHLVVGEDGCRSVDVARGVHSSPPVTVAGP
jgi:Adenylate and Guanylate cyclase catalytic domain